MKLGYIRMPDENRVCTSQNQLTLADSLNFHIAYFPKTDPQQFAMSLRAPTANTKIALDAAAFGPLTPSQIESAVRHVNHSLDGKLCLGVEMCGARASIRSKIDAQAFETLFSYSPQPDQAPSGSRFPMKPPCPNVIGLPVTGAREEAKLAAARGYFPMAPSWLRQTEVARLWPAIVEGATSALRRALPAHWQLSRVVVIHDDPATIDAYVFGQGSPIRRHFARLAQLGLIGADVDAHIRRVVITGSPTKVSQDILALREAVGEFGTLQLVDPAGSDPAMTKNTMIRMAEDVLPMVDKTSIRTFKNLETT